MRVGGFLTVKARSDRESRPARSSGEPQPVVAARRRQRLCRRDGRVGADHSAADRRKGISPRREERGALVIVVFGVNKALTNYLAGRFSDRFGRKQVLVGGWLVAIPVPFLLKIDLAGPEKRGLAMGLNEFAGYFAVAGSALATGFVAARHGLRPEPFAARAAVARSAAASELRLVGFDSARSLCGGTQAWLPTSLVGRNAPDIGDGRRLGRAA